MSFRLQPLKRRRFAQHFMVEGIRLGLSGRTIADQLRSVGLGYRNAVYLKDLRRIRRFKPRKMRMTLSELQSLQPDRRTLSMLGRGRTKYQQVFQLPIKSFKTGKVVREQTISFISSRKMIPDVAIALAPYTNVSTYAPDGEPAWDLINSVQEVEWIQTS